MDATGAFFPLSETQAQAALEALFHETPHQHGILQTRWRLEDIAHSISWLQGSPPGSVSAQLRRLGFSWKQPERFQRSPDPAYESKVAAIAAALTRATSDPEHCRLLYLDELTYYRHASLKRMHQRKGSHVHRLVERPGANTKTRIAAALDALDGSVCSVQRSHVGVRESKRFLKQLSQESYAKWPELHELIVVLDNWPVHYHEVVTAQAAASKIDLLYLPTYSSWLNPVERLWRWMRQEITHSHPFGSSLKELRSKTKEWLAQRVAPSPLTRYRTGLLSQADCANTY